VITVINFRFMYNVGKSPVNWSNGASSRRAEILGVSELAVNALCIMNIRRHEDIQESGGLAPPILNFGTMQS
jgi:hypothetical protein